MSAKKPPNEDERSSQGSADVGRGASDLDHLRALAELRDHGVISEKEFAAKKAQILGVRKRASRPPRSRRFKLTVLGFLALLLLAGGSTATALKISHDNKVKADRERADARRVAVAAQQAADAKARRDREAAAAEIEKLQEEFELSAREDLERGLRRSITKHARGAVADGLLEGPIKRTVCDPIGGGLDDLQASTGKYECLAVREEESDGTARGYSYDGTINYDKSSWTWKLGG
ncbi:MAG TPA: SHOCT domain-containing protein [Solirubrobacteraceae bacterium]|nr:SHOCT domain-containing protein [Solirubrobacteraceae bacterium]